MQQLRLFFAMALRRINAIVASSWNYFTIKQTWISVQYKGDRNSRTHRHPAVLGRYKQLQRKYCKHLCERWYWQANLHSCDESEAFIVFCVLLTLWRFNHEGPKKSQWQVATYSQHIWQICRSLLSKLHSRNWLQLMNLSMNSEESVVSSNTYQINE